MSGPAPSGPRGNTPGPGAGLSPEEIREVRRRSDKMIGIMLFIIGIFATVVNMTVVTADGIAQQAALAFEQYQIGEYVRPEGLEALGLVGIILHPLNYAIWLYVALKRWQAKKFGGWCAIVGAVIALLLSLTILMIGLMAHPEMIAWVEQGAPMPTPTPTP
ncbi:MAG: DUF6264 family protein [Gulosibacter sp.]|uniref:DUF6264 family protein n=1 Tax=Gulosibacter sp. TaxID=2817531 RepID=UPI003F8F5C74